MSLDTRRAMALLFRNCIDRPGRLSTTTHGRFTVRPALWFFFVFGLALLPDVARAQFIGYTTPQTIYSAPFSGATCAPAGSLQNASFSNLGQNQHAATITVNSGNPVSLTMVIQGIDNSGNPTNLSDTAFLGGNQVSTSVYGYGSFPSFRIQVFCQGTATFSVSYTGTSSNTYANVGTFLNSMVEKALASAAPANANFTSNAGNGTIIPPFGNTAGDLIFKYTGAGPAGSTVTVACQLDFIGGGYSQVFPISTVSTVQFFPVAANPCGSISVTYTSGGASAQQFSMDYAFVLPGQSASGSTALNLGAALNSAPTLTEKGSRWTQISTPAAGAQATTSKAAGTGGVRHVADCVSYSAGAIAAPVATTLQINLRDGATGAGTIIWSKTVTIPATAAPHYDGNFCGLNLIGSSATAMTLEFSALLASESESVTLTGYDVQ